MNSKLSKKIYLGVVVILSFGVLTVFQNCQSSSGSFKGQKDSALKKYDYLSELDQKQMLLVEDDVRAAHINVYDFVEIIDKIHDLIVFINQHPVHEIPPGTENTPETQQLVMENLGTQINQLGRFFDVLNVIPLLNTQEKAFLDSAIDRIRSIPELSPTDSLLHSLLILIELKQTLVEQFADSSGQFQYDSSGRPLTETQSRLLVIKPLLVEFIEAMSRAKPSMRGDLEKFSSGFIYFLEKAILLQPLGTTS